MTSDSALLLWVFGVLAGSMLFFAAAVAPTVFRALPAEHAGAFLRAFFPLYYLWGLVVAVIAAVIAVGSHWLLGAGCALVAFLFGYARQVLMPQINQARDAKLRGEPGAGKRFEALHLRSVIINGFQLLVLIAAAAYLVWDL